MAGTRCPSHAQKDFVDHIRRSARDDTQGLAREAHIDIVIRVVAQKSQMFMAPTMVTATLRAHDVVASDSTSSSVAPLAKMFSTYAQTCWAGVNAKSP